MLDSRTAAQKAIDYFSQVYSIEIGQSQFRNLMIEEIEKDVNGDWLITLGIDQTLEVPALLRGYTSPMRRLYKQFKVSDTNGDVVWMKIREVN